MDFVLWALAVVWPLSAVVLLLAVNGKKGHVSLAFLALAIVGGPLAAFAVSRIPFRCRRCDIDMDARDGRHACPKCGDATTDGTLGERVLNIFELDETPVLSFWAKFTYAFGQVAVSLSPALISSWLIYFYIGRKDASGNDILLVSAAAMSVGGLVPRLLEAVAEPMVGYLSDKWHFRMGRRIPWVVFGTPFLAIFSILIFFPPDGAGEGASLVSALGVDVTPNFLFLLATHTGFWVMYTAVVAPYLSLLPEITPLNNERIQASNYMAFGDVAGSVLGTAGVGMMIGALAGGITLGPIHLSNAYEAIGVILGVVFTLMFYISVWKVRERPHDASKAVKFKFTQAFVETFRNPTFTPYVIASAAIRMATDILLAGMPFIVTRLMNLDEEYAGYLQGVLILGAMLFFPLVASKAVKYGKKTVYLFGMGVFALDLLLMALLKHFPFLGYPVAFVAGLLGSPLDPNQIAFAHTVITLAIGALPVAVIFVMQRPILNDVMDHDEKLTGYRREAMYNGMEGLVSKPASGLAYFIVPLLLTTLGDSAEHPWGVLATPLVASVLLFLGYLGFRSYPLDK